MRLAAGLPESHSRTFGECERRHVRRAADGLRERFAWAVRVRWLAIGGFLVLGGVAWFAGVLLDPMPCIGAAVAASVLNAANQAAVRRWRKVGAASAAAVLGDVLLITILVARTGGPVSPFVAMYAVQVLASAMLVEVRVALACAAAAVLALVGAIGIGSPGIVGSGVAFGATEFFPTWMAFFAYGLGLVSYVGGHVSEQLRYRERALERSNDDLLKAVATVEQQNRELAATCQQLEQTERELAQSEKMRALGDFVAGVAHELNNPTAIIAANIEILEAELVAGDGVVAAPEAVEEGLRDCREAVGRAARIVSDLRQFSRAGGARRWSELDLNERVRRTVRLARHLFGGAVAVEVELQPIPCLRGVPAEVDQLLLNLLSNAAHAVGEAGVVVVSTALAGGAGRPAVRLRVADDGPGIPPGCVDRIFEPFFTTRDEGAGVGLGLSLAFAIAERHGGSICVDQTVSRGACFDVTLPLGENVEPDGKG